MKRILLLVLIAIPFFSNGQVGIGYHQSNLPFFGVNYQVGNKLRPEIRIGTDHYFSNLSAEAIIAYDLVQKEEYQFYAAAGIRINGFTGLVVPVGVNIYPLSAKNFGFHIELAPFIGENSLLRGSWGIRYRFNKK